MQRRLTVALLAIGGCLATPGYGDIASLASDIGDCVARVPARSRSGPEAVRQACPDLEQRISDSALRDQLGDAWGRRADASALTDLASLIQHYQQQPASEGPKPSSLQSITQSLRQPQAVNHGWWQRFKDWLRSLLAPQQKSDSGWLERLLSHVGSIPRIVQKIIFYSALVTLLVMAIVIVWRELKAAGIGTRVRNRAPERDASQLSIDVARAVTMRDVESSPAWDRPALLLRVLVQALMQSGRLRSERSLTHGELIRRAAFDNREQLRRFAHIASLAEYRLYGTHDAAAAATDDEDLLRDARDLHSQLLAGASGTAK